MDRDLHPLTRRIPTHGCRQANVTAVSFTKKLILIAGSAYTGEIKKGMFS